MQKIKKLLAILALGLLLSGCSGALTKGGAKEQAEEFINSVLLNEQFKAEVASVEDSGLYKLNINIINLDSDEKQEVVSYINKDGTEFIPEVQAMNIEETTKAAEEEKKRQEQAKAELVKSEKPQVELFVMSHCPFGTQIEKGILPVLELLGDKIDFQLKFVYYAMHGETELNEQLKQYCIQKEEPQKLFAYLKAFLEDSDSEKASSTSGINTAAIDSCAASADKEFKVKEQFADNESWIGGNYPPFDIYKSDNEKYGVQGSPTLVINEKLIEGADRSPAGLLEAICSAFETEPEECSTELSAAAPSAGFGFGESGASSDASCG